MSDSFWKPGFQYHLNIKNSQCQTKRPWNGSLTDIVFLFMIRSVDSSSNLVWLKLLIINLAKLSLGTSRSKTVTK